MSVLDDVVVATDSQEIVDVCRGFGARALLTSPAHQSGTDRVAEVAGMRQFKDHGIVVNIQGDEPLVTEEQVAECVKLVRSGWDVGTVATPVVSLEDWRDPAVVKVVRARDGSALYFSRAPIPFCRDGDPAPEDLGAAPYLRHLGIYAYTRTALASWTELLPEPLEGLERLEQLRPLSAGIRIGVGIVSRGGGGVDTPTDASRMARRLEAAAGPAE